MWDQIFTKEYIEKKICKNIFLKNQMARIALTSVKSSLGCVV